MQITVDKLMELPELEIIRKELNERMEEEKRRRQKFYKEVKEDQKIEFINGHVIVHSPAKLIHIQVQERIFTLLYNHVTLHNLGVIGYDKLMLSLTRNDYEPDICYFSSEKSKYFKPDDMFFPAADFVVEVLSKSTEKRDRGVKFIDYAKHGVLEYWIVSAQKQTIEQYHLIDGSYQHIKTWTEGEIESIGVPGLRFDVSVVFDPILFMRWVEKDKQEIVKLSKSIKEKDSQLHEKDNQLLEKDTQLMEQSTQLQEKDNQLLEQSTQLQEKDTTIEELKKKLEQLKNL